MKLSNGREFYASGDILGLSECEPDTLYHGYDGYVDEANPHYESAERPHFTAAERQEISERMIALWRRWARGIDQGNAALAAP